MSNLPSGEIPRGAIRFNTDSNRVEVWNGSIWGEMQLSYVGLATATDSDIGPRGLFFGGAIAPHSAANIKTDIDFINIASTGNSHDFGNLNVASSSSGTIASSTRGISYGGYGPSSPTRLADVDFVTISTRGIVTDWGVNSPLSRAEMGAVNNETRGLFCGGSPNPSPGTSTEIQMVTIASAGTAIIDTDNLSRGWDGVSSVNSPVRGVMAGGRSPAISSLIDFVSIPSLGDSQNFGDLSGRTLAFANYGAVCSPIRGLFMGGYNPVTNSIQYVTISTTGNGAEFGDLSVGRDQSGGCSSPTRGVCAGGRTSPSPQTHTDTIDYVQIQTLGNAVDFGNLGSAFNGSSGCSNAHGGL